jgi:hypothetical protein
MHRRRVHLSVASDNERLPETAVGCTSCLLRHRRTFTTRFWRG